MCFAIRCESNQKDGPQTGSKVSTIVEDLDTNYFSARERIDEEAMSSFHPSQTGMWVYDCSELQSFLWFMLWYLLEMFKSTVNGFHSVDI
jgi:hypothetical protein